MATQWQQKQLKMQDVLDQSINKLTFSYSQPISIHNQSIFDWVSFFVQQRLSDQSLVTNNLSDISDEQSHWVTVVKLYWFLIIYQLIHHVLNIDHLLSINWLLFINHQWIATHRWLVHNWSPIRWQIGCWTMSLTGDHWSVPNWIQIDGWSVPDWLVFISNYWLIMDNQWTS